MKRLLLIFLFIFPISIFAQKDQINEEWLRKDKSNFINLMDILLSENWEINYFLKKIKNLGIRSNQDIGFDAKRYECAQGGGYISNWISIYTLNDTIFYCKISITSNDVDKMEILAQRDSLILKLLSQNWNRKTYKQNSGLFESFDYEYINNGLYSKYKERVKNELGEIYNDIIDSKIQEDYQILISPFEKYDFGYACYFSGTQPEGRIAIENIKNQNPYLVRNIIRGLNPEGRIYGIEALFELIEEGKLELTLDDKQTIEKVLRLKTPINRCQGCMVSSISAYDLFNEKAFLNYIKKNNIVLE